MQIKSTQKIDKSNYSINQNAKKLKFLIIPVFL